MTEMRPMDWLRCGKGIAMYTLARHHMVSPAPAKPWMARQNSCVVKSGASAQATDVAAKRAALPMT
jgi:hypothetical protein